MRVPGLSFEPAPGSGGQGDLIDGDQARSSHASRANLDQAGQFQGFSCLAPVLRRPLGSRGCRRLRASMLVYPEFCYMPCALRHKSQVPDSAHCATAWRHAGRSVRKAHPASGGARRCCAAWASRAPAWQRLPSRRRASSFSTTGAPLPAALCVLCGQKWLVMHQQYAGVCPSVPLQ